MTKKFKRGFINSLLLFTFLLTVSLAIIAFSNEEWNTIASCLAVITAVLATNISLRVIWKQEDEYEPDIVVSFDLESKTGIIQFVLENVGGSNAYDIKLNWHKKLPDGRGKLIDLPYIPVLPKKGIIRVFVDGSTKRFQQAKKENIDLYYSGEIKYKYFKRDKRYLTQNFEIGLPQFQHKAKPHTDEKDFYSKNIKLTENIRELNKIIKTLVVNKDNEQES